MAKVRRKLYENVWLLTITFVVFFTAIMCRSMASVYVISMCGVIFAFGAGMRNKNSYIFGMIFCITYATQCIATKSYASACLFYAMFILFIYIYFFLIDYKLKLKKFSKLNFVYFCLEIFAAMIVVSVLLYFIGVRYFWIESIILCSGIAGIILLFFKRIEQFYFYSIGTLALIVYWIIYTCINGVQYLPIIFMWTAFLAVETIVNIRLNLMYKILEKRKILSESIAQNIEGE